MIVVAKSESKIENFKLWGGMVVRADYIVPFSMAGTKAAT